MAWVLQATASDLELSGQDVYWGVPSGLTPMDRRGWEQDEAEGRVEQ